MDALLFWKLSSLRHAKGEAQARAQQAIALARAADHHFRGASEEYTAAMRAAGFTGDLDGYRFDKANEAIVQDMPADGEQT